MTTRRPAHRPSRRAHVLRAALSEIGRDGRTGELPTVSAIATAAGATPAAIHYHFPSRTDLYVALIDDIHPRVMALFEDARPEDGIRTWTDRFFHRVADWVEANPLEARYYFLVAPAIAQDKVVAASTRTREEFLEMVSADLPAVQESDLYHWIHAVTLREIIIAALETGLKNRDTPPRGFYALRRAGTTIADRLAPTAEPVVPVRA